MKNTHLAMHVGPHHTFTHMAYDQPTRAPRERFYARRDIHIYATHDISISYKLLVGYWLDSRDRY